MSKRSKVIRASVATIFLLVLVMVISILTMDSLKVSSNISVHMKIWYVLTLVIAIVGYGFLKNKLVKMNIKKSIEYIYRYIYLFLITIGTRLIAAYIYQNDIVNQIDLPLFGNDFGSYFVRFLGNVLVNEKYAPLIINTAIAFVIAVCIKRIMFNITMNEILSSVAAIIYLFMPLGITSTVIYTSQIFNTVFILLAIYVTLKMIDEVKQHKLNNNKYIHLSLTIAMLYVLDLIFGGTIYMVLCVSFLTMIIGDNIDFIQINFRKSFVDKFDIKIKKIIYKLERLKISKLVIGMFSTIIFILTIGLIISLVVKNNNVWILPADLNITQIIDNIKGCFGESRNYYILAFSLIVILEILGKILDRKKDTKSTFFKIIFVVALVISGFNNKIYNVYVIDVVTSILLVLNLGNIYYNREEKIKLLK